MLELRPRAAKEKMAGWIDASKKIPVKLKVLSTPTKLRSEGSEV